MLPNTQSSFSFQHIQFFSLSGRLFILTFDWLFLSLPLDAVEKDLQQDSLRQRLGGFTVTDG